MIKKKILVWSFGNYFNKKILPLFNKKKFVEIERILTKKKIKKINQVIFNNKKKFFNKIKSKYIYINSNQKDHYKNIKFSLKKNLNVICEKSLCMNYLQTKEIIDLANKKKLKIFCCHYYTFHPIFNYLKKIIEKKNLGNLRMCVSGFSYKNDFCNDKTYRSKKILGASSILDLGFYPLSLEFFLFENYKKNIIASNLNISKKLKFDISGDVLLNSNQFSRHYFWSYEMNYKNFINLVFERGEIYVDFFFSKNTDQIILKIKNKNKIDKKIFKNLITQEEIAFRYFLKNKPSRKYYNNLLKISSMIDKIKSHEKYHQMV